MVWDHWILVYSLCGNMCYHVSRGCPVHYPTTPPLLWCPLMFYHRWILKAPMFTQSGVYVNTSHVDPAQLYINNQCLYLSDKKCLAVGIMTGTVTESFLVDSAEAGHHTSLFQVHKVTIAPFKQDWRCDASLWGLLFKFSIVSGASLQQGFSFSTCGKGKGDTRHSCEFFF